LSYTISDASYDSTCVQFRLNRGRDTLRTASDINSHALAPFDSTRWLFEENQGTNWVYETAISWLAILPKGNTLNSIIPYFARDMRNGFQVTFGDADKVAGNHVDRWRQMSWDLQSAGDSGYNNRTHFGVVSMGQVGDDCHTWGECDGIHNTATGKTKFYPNPTAGIVTIENLEGVTTVSVMNMAGIKVQTFNMINTNTLDLSQFPDGIYLIKAGTAFGMVNLSK
jgi:hypothetical protein